MTKFYGFNDDGSWGAPKGRHAGSVLHKGAVNRREAARAAKHAKQVKLQKAAKAKAVKAAKAGKGGKK